MQQPTHWTFLGLLLKAFQTTRIAENPVLIVGDRSLV